MRYSFTILAIGLVGFVTGHLLPSQQQTALAVSLLAMVFVVGAGVREAAHRIAVRARSGRL